MATTSARQIDALVSRWGRTRRQLAAAARTALLARWRPIDPYDPTAVEDFAVAAAATSQAAQDRSRILMEAFLRTVFTVLDQPISPAPIVRTGVPARAGVEPAQVYLRPAETVRYQRSLDVPAETAAERGARRLEQLVDMDIAVAARDGASEVLDAVGEVVTGYRRVIRPELSKGGSCGLCIVAADRVYRRGDLLPIHDGCHCVVLPITRSEDPGERLNRDDLRALYAAAGGTGRDQLKRIQLKVVEHGELGAILTNAGHEFRDERAVAGAARAGGKRTVAKPIDPVQSASRGRQLDAQIAALEKTFAGLQKRRAAGESVSKPYAYQESQLARLRAERARLRAS